MAKILINDIDFVKILKKIGSENVNNLIHLLYGNIN